MGRAKLNQMGTALLLTALMAVSAETHAADSDLYLAGLGLHQETGRNIYLGGIYLERESAQPNDFTATDGERVMEYRVVARRTSIRSLLGGMLLQSEVATGAPPGKATADFIDEILSTVNTSLYAGDSLEIRLTESNETIALLNGHELARVAEKSVADYLLMGWVGESGPSTTFRDNITAGEVDPSLLSALEANTYSAQREAEIAAWLGEAEEPEPAVEAPEAAAEVAVTSATEAQQPVEVQTAQVEELAGEAAESSEESSSAAGTIVAAGSTAQNTEALEMVVTSREPLQVASLISTPEMLPQKALEQEVENLGIREYSQRLTTFHTNLVRKVYGEIRYPKRAVRRGLEGRLELDVTMTASGEILSIAVAMPSGHKLLDEAAVKAAHDAFDRGLSNIDPVALAEFGDFTTEQLTVPVPVQFKLQ